MQILASHHYVVNGGYTVWLTLMGQEDMEEYKQKANGYGNGTSVVVSPIRITDTKQARGFELLDTRYEHDLWDAKNFKNWGTRYLEDRFGHKPTFIG